LSRAIVLFAIINAMAGVVVALSRAHIPHPPFWDEHERAVLIAIVTVSFLPLLQAIVSELGERKKRKAAELAATLQEILAGTLIDLTENAGADWKKTGVQVFRLRRWWLFSHIQVRLGKIRIAHIAPSGIKWRKGKGLIGKCWATGLPVSKNLDTHFAKYRHLNETAWNNLHQTVEKYGLSYKEFKKINDKYGLVVAFPLTRADKYIGCITVDMPPECSASVDEAKVSETLSAAAPSIAAVIEGR
jgi:hypothetical protein